MDLGGISIILYLAIFFVFLLGYWFGRFVQKRWPNRHLRPWKWRIHRH